MRKRQGNQLDERYAKRLQLTNAEEDAIHRSVVEAIYSIGLKHASPAVLLDRMSDAPEDLTSERVKSHLQKHRNSKDKVIEEFMGEYDSWLQKAFVMGGEGRGHVVLASPRSLLDMMGQSEVQAGEMAAYLTYSIFHEPLQVMAAESSSTKDARAMSHASLRSVSAKSSEYTLKFAGSRVRFPILTEDERKSPLGSAFSHVMGTLHALNRHFMQERLTRDYHQASVSPANRVAFSPSRHVLKEELQSIQQSFYQQSMLPSAPAEQGYRGDFRQFHPLEQRESHPDMAFVREIGFTGVGVHGRAVGIQSDSACESAMCILRSFFRGYPLLRPKLDPTAMSTRRGCVLV